MSNGRSQNELSFRKFIAERMIRTPHNDIPSSAVSKYKEDITNSGHTIITHRLDHDGDHCVIHRNPNKKMRVTMFHASYDEDGQVQTTAVDRPATPEEEVKYGE